MSTISFLYLKQTSVKLIALFSLLSLAAVVNAQDVSSSEAKELIPAVRFSDNINVKFGGFFRAEYYIDSREIVGAVDDLFGFFPENKKLDAEGNDLNDVVRQNISTQATRFTTLLNGPSLLNAKSSAYVEFDFSGGGTVNVRLRQAWAKLNWNKAELLIGKTWIPFADTPFPNVAGLHVGIPFRAFGRGDQLRVTLKPTTNFQILAAGVFQTEHKSVLEPSAQQDIRSNPIPDLHLQVKYVSPSFNAGILSEYKVIRPATQVTGADEKVYTTDEKVSSWAVGGFIQGKHNKLNILAGSLYGTNLSELFQQGGYAVKSIDPVTGKRTYSTSKVSSTYLNVSYGKRWIAGIFGGYSKNLGFNNDLVVGGDFFGRWQNVDHIYRISPSLKFVHKQWTIQAEVDYDVAGYGRVDYADKGKVKDVKDIAGARGILATTFFF